MPQEEQTKYLDDLQLITGIDIPVPELTITLRQPRIKEIAMLTERLYFVALSMFKMDKADLKISGPEVTNWKIFQEALNQKIDGIENPRVLVTNFTRLFSSHTINFGPRSIMISVGDEIVNIDESNFDLFQKIICEIGGAGLLSASEEKFNPVNARAAAIAEKMKKSRAKLAKQKPQTKSDGFLARYIKALATVTANSVEDICNLTLYQVNEMMQMYIAWEQYDLETKSRLAGAKSDKKIVHWIMSGKEDDSKIGTI